MVAFPLRLSSLVFTAMLVTAAASAQAPPAAPASPDAVPSAVAPSSTPSPILPVSAEQDAPELKLPISLDRIRKALEQPAQPPLKLPDTPTFRVNVQERNRLQELLSTLDFRSGPTPAGGLYAAEVQRVMFPSVSNPQVQAYGAFNQPELLTILIENLVGKYLIGKAFSSMAAGERARAEEAARQEVRDTIAQYCAGQPDGGAGIKICSTTTPP
jgi:hypothetical protein